MEVQPVIQLMLGLAYLVFAPVLLLVGGLLKLIGYLLPPRGVRHADVPHDKVIE